MKQLLIIFLLGLCEFSVSCNSENKANKDESINDVNFEWDETGLEEDSIYEDPGDIKDDDIIDNESEVIEEKAG